MYLLFRIRYLEEFYGKEFKVDVDERSIITSLVCAFLHVALEIANLTLESKTSDTNMQDYMVACYSARLGWLPSQRKFHDITDEDNKE
jgi:hypothetical protein